MRHPELSKDGAIAPCGARQEITPRREILLDRGFKGETVSMHRIVVLPIPDESRNLGSAAITAAPA
jgi:hypothetical protein